MDMTWLGVAWVQEIFADDGGRVWDRCSVVAYFPPEVSPVAAYLEQCIDACVGPRRRCCRWPSPFAGTEVSQLCC